MENNYEITEEGFDSGVDSEMEDIIEQPESKYFAAKEGTQAASVLLEKAKTFYTRMESNNFIERIRNMWRAYHGYYGEDSHEIGFTGEQGELTELPVNHFRNLARHVYTIITSNRPVMDARAINSDYKSLAQTHLANGVLDYYMREKKLEEAIQKAAEHAVALSTGYIKLEWNATAGELYDVDPDTGEFNYEGEIEFTNPTIFDIVGDGTKDSWNNEWLLVRSFKNKHNLAAKFSKYAEKIQGLETKSDSTMSSIRYFSNDETDDIPVYEFFHEKTEAMPDGRYMLFLASDIVLIDTPMPYNKIPVYRIVPSEILGTPYGYTDMFDVYPLQEAINSQFSTIMSNHAALGVQNIFVPRGADLSLSVLEGGLNVIEGNAKPEPLNLTQTPAEIFNFLNLLVQTAETLSGINSVVRGNPEYSLRSGNALALVQSNALQFISGLQQSYIKMIEDVGTGLLQILKDYAQTPKLVALVGRNKRTLLKEFTGDMISNINRVIVDVGNPLARTIAGRVQMAEQMAQMGLIKNPNQYFQILSTGRLETAYEGEISELLLIKEENEMIMQGESVEAAFLDQHRMHILEHRALMADPKIRKDPASLQLVASHIQQHVDLLRNTDPDILQLINEQPLNPQQQSGSQQLPPGPIQAAQGQGNPSDMMNSPAAQGQMPQIAEATLPQPPGEFANQPVTPSQMV